MADVHISYSSRDEALAQRCYDYLVQSGFRVWQSSRSLLPGSNWVVEWYRSLRVSHILLLLVSPASNDSPNVQREWNYFLVAGKPIIPLRIDNTDVPDALRDITYLPISANEVSQENLAALENAVRALLTPPSEVRNRVVMQIQETEILTPEMLSAEIMPFIAALTELQHLLDQMQGRTPRAVHLKQISQNSEIKIDVGLAEIVLLLREVLTPWGREQARLENEAKRIEARMNEAKTNADLRKQAEETEALALDNETKRLQLELQRIEVQIKTFELATRQGAVVPLRMAQGSAPASTDDSSTAALLQLMQRYPEVDPATRAAYIAKMQPALRAVLQSGVQFASPPTLTSNLPAMPTTLPEYDG